MLAHTPTPGTACLNTNQAYELRRRLPEVLSLTVFELANLFERVAVETATSAASVLTLSAYMAVNQAIPIVMADLYCLSIHRLVPMRPNHWR